MLALGCLCKWIIAWAAAAPWQHTAETAKHSLAAADKTLRTVVPLENLMTEPYFLPENALMHNFTYGCVGFLDPGLGAPLIVVLGKTIQHVR